MPQRPARLAIVRADVVPADDQSAESLIVIPSYAVFLWLFLLLAPSASAAAHGGASVGTLPGDPAACPLTLVAEEGMPIPGGGVLFRTNPASVNGRGELVFAARITGDPRDQAILVADADGLRVIARGCGGVGGAGQGCGDPTPLGGTYTGFYGGTALPPMNNSRGDIAFSAEIVGGSSTQAHFLYRAATGEIETVAAVGDPSPRGDFLAVLGPATLGEHGDIVFGAWDSDSVIDGIETYLLRWRDGSLESVLAPGDTLPDGHVVQRIGGSFVVFGDGSKALLRPSPTLTEDSRIVVSARVNDSFPVVETDGREPRFITQPGEPDPGGGTISLTNEAVSRGGRYAFTSNSIAIGTPGSWQAAWAPGQEVDGDPVDSIPSFLGDRPVLDESGQMTFVFGFQSGPEDRLMRWNEHDGLFTLAAAGDPVPGGGVFRRFFNFNGVNARGDAALETLIERPGGSIVGAFFLLDNCAAGRIFADGFESGTADAWSIVAP